MPASGNASIAVFDVCHTLFRDNTTAGFVDYYCRRMSRRARGAVVASVRRRWSPVRPLLLLLGKVLRADLARLLLIRQLTGERRQDLEAVANDYVEHLLRDRKIPAVWSILERRAPASKLVFASASLDVVVDALARKFDGACIASALEFVDGTCTGRLASDATGRKADLVARRLGVGIDSVVPGMFVCTDNVSDVDLLMMASEGVAVCARKGHGLDRIPLPEKIVHVYAS